MLSRHGLVGRKHTSFHLTWTFLHEPENCGRVIGTVQANTSVAVAGIVDRRCQLQLETSLSSLKMPVLLTGTGRADDAASSLTVFRLHAPQVTGLVGVGRALSNLGWQRPAILTTQPLQAQDFQAFSRVGISRTVLLVSQDPNSCDSDERVARNLRDLRVARTPIIVVDV